MCVRKNKNCPQRLSVMEFHRNERPHQLSPVLLCEHVTPGFLGHLGTSGATGQVGCRLLQGNSLYLTLSQTMNVTEVQFYFC